MHTLLLILAFLALLHVLPAHAQQTNNTTSNLTITFYPNTPSNQDQEACHPSPAALTFTTNSLPTVPACFNLSSLFTGARTQNRTTGLLDISWGSGPNETFRDFAYTLSSVAAFNASAGYARVLVQQPGGADGEAAPVEVRVHAEEGCGVFGESAGYACFTGAEGECGAGAFGVRSFRVQMRAPGRLGECALGAFESGAGGIGRLGLGGVGVGVVVGLVGLVVGWV